MIKVLIVDDEFRVCQLICNLIDWGSLDMQIIGVAHNGIEARELARETVPDLVITDIRMPGCTGLELVEQLREIYRSVSFIIISGYTNFEYTRLAIQYGVSDYLLKPIDKEELLATVTLKITFKPDESRTLIASKAVVTTNLQPQEPQTIPVVLDKLDGAPMLFESFTDNRPDQYRFDGTSPTELRGNGNVTVNVTPFKKAEEHPINQ